jgi:hypothetical protein
MPRAVVMALPLCRFAVSRLHLPDIAREIITLPLAVISVYFFYRAKTISAGN